MYDRGPMAGNLFETYIVSQIVKHARHTNRRCTFYFFRTNHGMEIDLVIETGLNRELVEIKKTATFRSRLVETLATFAPEAQRATLVYEGETLPDYSGIRISNWSDYLLTSGMQVK